MTDDFSAEIPRPRSSAHAATSAACEESAEAADVKSGEEAESVKSSTNEEVVVSEVWGYVETKKLKSIGEMHDP